MPIACVFLQPWALKVAQRQHPDVPLVILSEGRRVIEASPGALEAGVTLGSPSVTALSRCPDLHLEVLDPAALKVAWQELLETLYARYSPRVEGQTPGLAFLHATLPQARELATALHAPVGLACLSGSGPARCAAGHTRRSPRGRH